MQTFWQVRRDLEGRQTEAASECHARRRRTRFGLTLSSFVPEVPSQKGSIGRSTVFPVSTMRQISGYHEREEFWFIVAARSEDETEPQDRASELRAGQSAAEQVLKDIRRQTRRQYSAEEKIRIVLEGLRGEESVSELCRARESPPQVLRLVQGVP